MNSIKSFTRVTAIVVAAGAIALGASGCGALTGAKAASTTSASPSSESKSDKSKESDSKESDAKESDSKKSDSSESDSKKSDSSDSETSTSDSGKSDSSKSDSTDSSTDSGSTDSNTDSSSSDSGSSDSSDGTVAGKSSKLPASAKYTRPLNDSFDMRNTTDPSLSGPGWDFKSPDAVWSDTYTGDTEFGYHFVGEYRFMDAAKLTLSDTANTGAINFGFVCDKPTTLTITRTVQAGNDTLDPNVSTYQCESDPLVSNGWPSWLGSKGESANYVLTYTIESSDPLARVKFGVSQMNLSGKDN